MSKRELLFSITKKDFDIQTFRAGGKGGQHQNTTDSGVRIIHRESKISSESRTERSQRQNMKLAFRKLVNKSEFKTWLKIKIAKVSGDYSKIDEEIKKTMSENFLKIETKKDGKWVLENE